MNSIVYILFFLLSFQVFGNCDGQFQKLENKILSTEFDLKFFKKINHDELQSFIRNQNKEKQELIITRLLEISDDSLLLSKDFVKLINRLADNGIEKNILNAAISKNKSRFRILNFNPETHQYELLLMTPKEHLELVNKTFEKLTINLDAKESLKTIYLENDFPLEMGEKVLKSLTPDLVKSNNHESYYSFFKYLKNKPLPLQKKLINSIDEIFNPESSNLEIKKFQKLQNKFSNFERRQKEKLFNEMKNKDALSKSIIEVKAKNQRKIYEHLYHSCANKETNTNMQIASRKLNMIKQVISNASSILGYTTANWNKEKNLDWFSRLGYEIGMTTATGFISATVNRKKYDDIFKQSLANYTTYGVIDIVDTNLYNFVFNNNSKIEEQFNQIKNSPDWKNDISDLEQFLKNSNIENHFYQRMTSYFGNSDQDLDKITLKDLESEEVKELILEMIALKLYEESQDGAIIQTGSSPLDYYTYNRIFGVIAAPKAVLLGNYLTKVLCMSKLNPTLAYFQVLSLYTLDSILTDQLYYNGRNYLLTPQK